MGCMLYLETGDIWISGGLTRGHGMSEKQRTIWLCSMPVTAEVNRAMQDFTGPNYQTSDQCKDTAQT